MARKLTIRRVGGLLPALSLVVLVLLASLITWLSTAGLPDCALRRIEQEAARQGIYLHIGQLKLSPASGLAIRARRVELYASQNDTTPLARVYRATVGISASQLLFHRRLSFTMAEFRGLNITLPTDGDEPLVLNHASASAIIRNGRFVRLTSGSAIFERIPITLQGAFMLPEADTSISSGSSESGKAVPLDLKALLEPYRATAGRIHRALASQHWSVHDCPSVHLRLQALRRTQLGAVISIPRYDEGQFHFRDAHIDIAYQNNSIIINKIRFKTVDPDSHVDIQGGYDIPERQLSAHITSTAALTRMAEAITIPGVNMECVNSWLSRFKHADASPPEIFLKTTVHFEEDYTLRNFRIEGTLQQKNFTFGKTDIDELQLAFYYEDGSFNLDKLLLTFPTGFVKASANAKSETGKGEATITGDLDIPHLLEFAGEFTTETPTLPEGLELTGNLQFLAKAELDMPAFISGSKGLEHFLPTIHQLELNASIGKASHHGHSVVKPSIELHILHPHQAEGELLPRGFEQAGIVLKAESFRSPSRGEGDSAITLNNAKLNLTLHEVSLLADDGSLSPVITSANGMVNIGSASVDDFRTEALSIDLSDAGNIHPLAGDWRQICRQAALRLTTGAMFRSDTLLGAFDGKLTLDEQGFIDLSAVLDRDGHRLAIDLHPQLKPDGMLTLNNVQLELPLAAFEPLLALTGTHITQILLPETLSLSGSATLDTRTGRLQQAEGTLDIPHLVRTPGDGVAAFRGEQIPLSVHASGSLTGKNDGNLTMEGELLVIHKTDDSPEGSRKLNLTFQGDTASHVSLKGRNTIDVCTVDRLIDLHDAHVIMRDFSTHAGSRTDVDIQSVDIRFTDGLTVTASCDADIANIGYQMNARTENAAGQETLRRDFGKDPFRKVEKATAHVDVLYRENAQGEVEATRISILNADMTYDNRPWLKSQGFKGGVARSRLQGDAVIIDVEDSFVELRNVHGRIYPSYAIGAYYDEIPGFLETLILQQPALVETDHCLFPIYDDCKLPMSGCIRVMAKEAGFHFLGTTFPLQNLSGFIFFEDGAVRLDHLNAACWDGAINAAFVIDYSKGRTGFDGYTTLRNINLQPLAAAYGSQQHPALCNGNIRFRTPTPELQDLQAYGDVHIVDGDLINLRVFRPVGDLISDLPGNLAELERKALHTEGKQPTWLDKKMTQLFSAAGDAFSSMGEGAGKVANNIPFANHFLRYDLQEAHGRFTIGQGKLVTDGLKVLGYNLNVGVQLQIDLDNNTLEGDLWPKISSVPTFILSPITFLSQFTIDIHIFGKLDDVQWRIGLARKKKEESADCSVTDAKPEKQVSPRKP